MADGQDTFRDSIATINDEGKRNFIFPKKPKGNLTNKRSLVAAGLLVFMFIAPWLRINDQPFLMLNVLERQFVIFGNIFWPQDSHLLVFALLSGVVFIIVFTVVFGRIFCGWFCPQTIFMEHVFRRIEYWIEGDRGQQIRLNKMSWKEPEKLRKKGLKAVVFWIIAFIISNDFVMILSGSDEWLRVVTEGPWMHWGKFVGIVAFTFVFYFVFAWFREQVCIIVCPYGRLQGAMLDRNSVVIAYDYKRGENRGRFKKKENRAEAKKGDCIDCNQCVDVCPTGIDIRNGTQLECINCTACIDACDAMMEKVDLPKGLIRYASENSIAEQKPHTYTIRAKAYTVVLVILLGVMGFLLAERPVVEATVLRATGLTYQSQENNEISNLYRYKIINKSTEPQNFELKVLDDRARLEFVGVPDTEVGVQKLEEGAFFVYVKRDALNSSNEEIKIAILVNNKVEENLTLNFLGPRKKSK
jgi:cytochrome c oxidase accessory protein FixG